MPLKVITPMLAELGFKKRKGGIYTLETGDGILGWLGLTVVTRGFPAGEPQILANVGVHVRDVERIVQELRGDANRTVTPTLFTPLVSLLPGGGSGLWHFTPQQTATTAAMLVGAIADHAVPFMRSVATYAELIGKIEAGVGHDHLLAYSLPVAWMLAGDTARARDALDRSVGSLGDRADLAADSMRRFADQLRARLDASG